MATPTVAIAAALLVVMPRAAAGQATTDLPAPAPTATPGPAALPIPAAPVIDLPSPRPTATAGVRERAAQASAQPTPRASASPRTRQAPAASDAAVRPPVAAAPPSRPLHPPSSASLPPARRPLPGPVGDRSGMGYWWAAFAALLLAAAALAWVLLRRRADPVVVEEPAAADRSPDPVERPATTVPSVLDRSAAIGSVRLALSFRPVRAGINLLSATSEGEITISNEGVATAQDVTLTLRLVSAHAGLDAELAEIAAAPPGRPVVPAFALQPGESRVVRAVGALPREAIAPMMAAGRPIFVPVVVLNLFYGGDDDGRRQVSQAFAIGVERVDSPRLAPFWLDAPPRSYDQVAARPHGPLLER